MLTFISFSVLVLGIFAGIALIGMAQKQRPPYPTCGQCGHNLTGVIGRLDCCPECGAEFNSVFVHPAGAEFLHPYYLAAGVAMIAISGFGGCLSAMLIYALRDN